LITPLSPRFRCRIDEVFSATHMATLAACQSLRCLTLDLSRAGLILGRRRPHSA
jgi:hypothetical protein